MGCVSSLQTNEKNKFLFSIISIRWILSKNILMLLYSRMCNVMALELAESLKPTSLPYQNPRQSPNVHLK